MDKTTLLPDDKVGINFLGSAVLHALLELLRPKLYHSSWLKKGMCGTEFIRIWSLIPPIFLMISEVRFSFALFRWCFPSNHQVEAANFVAKMISEATIRTACPTAVSKYFSLFIFSPLSFSPLCMLYCCALALITYSILWWIVEVVFTRPCAAAIFAIQLCKIHNFQWMLHGRRVCKNLFSCL